MSKSFRGETLVGQRFGDLMVLEFVSNDKKASYWKCECICDLKTQRILHKGDLNKEIGRSCRCKKKKILLPNQHFGKLITIEPTDERSNGKILWKCLCDCGSTTFVRSDHLLGGNTKSCGCLRNETNLKNIISQRFGKTTAIEKTDQRDINGSVIWKCLCDCGSLHLVRASSLIDGNTKSCGCLKSVGEFNIKKILNENNILYISEYKFPDLLSPLNTGYLLKFDFAIFINNKLSHLIEFQGTQHENEQIYENLNRGVDTFKNQELRDQAKVDYCIKNKIPLIKLPYKLRDKITLDNLQLKDNPYIINDVD